MGWLRHLSLTRASAHHLVTPFPPPGHASPPTAAPCAGSIVAVRNGSVRGGSTAAVRASAGGKAVVEGAVLQARGGGQADFTAAAIADGPGSVLGLRHCKLLLPPPTGTVVHICLRVGGGARATAADCACNGRAMVMGEGSSLLHSGLAFPPGPDPIFTAGGGVAHELAAAAGGGGRAQGGSA